MTNSPLEENLPLRWESTGEQWWFASPIDLAAANGQFDLVIELLHLDPNLLIKLTSLRRIRRLESLWEDDDDDDYHHPSVAAKNRAKVARKLLAGAGHGPLFRAGYGGWLLYTAAAAGDAKFAGEILRREPFLAYGEGEYGVTDLLYAAARGGNAEVFRTIVEHALRPEGSSVGEELRWEVVNRAAHAAARGGNVVVLREVLEEEGNDVAKFVDDQGCSLLHSAAGRGQVQVVKYLIENFSEIVTRVDNQGNTALHVAANRGFLPVVETLLRSSPSLSAATNNYGETFLHTAVAGFRAPGFRRLDNLIALVKSLVSGEIVDLGAIVNARNSEGRTALHLAVAENADVGIVEILMASLEIKLNVRDFEGMTPLDLLKRRPRSASSEILIKQMISAGGIANSEDRIRARIKKALASQIKNRHGFGAISPGTSFRIPDGEIFLFTGIEGSVTNSSDHPIATSRFSAFSGNLGLHDPSQKKKKNKKSASVDFSAAKRLNSFLLRWPKGTAKKKNNDDSGSDFDDEARNALAFPEERPKKHVPLRQKYSARIYNDDAPSPSAVKLRFAAGLTHGVIKTTNRKTSGELSESSAPEIICERNACMARKRRQSSLDEKMMMNGYFSFGAHEAVPSY